MKNKIFPILLAIMIFCCSVMSVEAASVSQNISSVSLAVGQTRTFSLKGATGKTSYKSSNTSVASVNKNGVITAKKQGNVQLLQHRTKRNIPVK